MKFYSSFICSYLFSAARAFFYLPLNIYETRPKKEKNIPIIVQLKLWSKVIFLSPINIIIMQFILTQLRYGIEKKYQDKIINILFSIIKQ